jgi:hypothetical protein
MISTLADHCLLMGMGQKLKVIDAYLTHDVVMQHLGAAA